ncbi:PTS sugar transporter subunit IIA [Lactobacillus corticis]|uniref:PTS sugar transporter IIA component n=1 Tax=Lactobacillus corticis TaxID=2201249 RepID=A0A916VIU2_9LACO|nr:PTS sugar transporter subunit IIA [Lactobacillus corticis]GFZ27703.1 PTS sugar transporter IIA component [Lactobacillus corticis]
MTTEFSPDAVFTSRQTEQDELLAEIYTKLLKLGYVKGNFLTHVVEREQKFPTGLDTKSLGSDLPNIAIPHTEGQFVNTQLIVPVALENPVVFHNMTKPEEALEVRFLFMLLDTKPDGQAKLLAEVMNFLARTPEKKLQILFNLHETSSIYEFLQQNF